MVIIQNDKIKNNDDLQGNVVHGAERVKSLSAEFPDTVL